MAKNVFGACHTSLATLWLCLITSSGYASEQGYEIALADNLAEPGTLCQLPFWNRLPRTPHSKCVSVVPFWCQQMSPEPSLTKVRKNTVSASPHHPKSALCHSHYLNIQLQSWNQEPSQVANLHGAKRPAQKVDCPIPGSQHVHNLHN